MVSFSCESCGDVLTKKKLDAHRNNQCRGTQFSCLDCMVTFQGTEYRSHTSCISEAQKYEKTLYKGDKKGNAKKQQQKSEPPTPVKTPTSAALVQANVFQFQVQETENQIAIVDAPPRAPSPPPFVNVFDFLVENGGQSRRSPSPDSEWEDEGDMHPDYETGGFSYGAEPVRPANTRYPSTANVPDYATPAAQKGHSRNISTESATKKGSKRKRTHVDDLDLSEARRFPPNGDVIMTDVPPVMHSGLTGGINRLLSRPEFPPSPDYSGGDGGDKSPGTPLRRAKDRDKAKNKERKSAAKEKEKEKERSHKRTRREGETSTKQPNGAGQWVQVRKRPGQTTTRKRSESPPAKSPHRSTLKAIEYKPLESNGDNALIVHPDRQNGRISTRAELFMSFINRAAEDSKGCSINKALKKYHRERGGEKTSTKVVEEKELWKVLRLRVNDRGEIVLFPGIIEK